MAFPVLPSHPSFVWRCLAGWLAILAGLALPVSHAVAQQRTPLPAPKSRKSLPSPPAQLPRALPADRAKGLDFLFGALKAAPDQASAKHVEGRIWAIWATTPSDTAALLMARVQTALEKKNADLALKLLDAVVKVRPDYIEGWNRRATLRYMKDDYTNALADIREVLAREPRHFGALTGLGMILQELGEDKRALEAYRAALAINPHLQSVPERIRMLTEKVEGRDI